MPEIWLNYGATDVVLDIRAENLDQNIDSGGATLSAEELAEKLYAGLDLKKPVELAVLHNSPNTQKIISALYMLCEQKSLPFPKILADSRILEHVKTGLPEGSTISELGENLLTPESRLVFVAEMELDGLFGFETIATRLMRMYGQEHMLAAYAKRNGNLPSPGQPTQSIREAGRFADGFEIMGIEILANSGGISDISVGHPSRTASISKSFESASVRDTSGHKAMIISTGKGSSNDTLMRSLSSLWNCHGGIRDGGLGILLGESQEGLGSRAIRRFLDGQLHVERLKNPPKYIDGMESLLYLGEIQKRIQVGIVSVLPELYIKRMGMIPLGGVKHALDYTLKVQGPRQKVVIVSDGARVLLR